MIYAYITHLTYRCIGRSHSTRVDSADQGSSGNGSPSLDLSQAPPSQVLSPGPLTPPTTHLSTALQGVDPHEGSTARQSTPARGRGFPSFAELSSPAGTSSIASLPRSPDLGTLSLRPNLSAHIDAFDGRRSRLSEVAQGNRLQSPHHTR